MHRLKNLNISKNGVHIRCADCVFVQSDENTSEKNWTAYECGNKSSPYHKALLNITQRGYPLSFISWCGCEFGKPTERQVATI